MYANVDASQPSCAGRILQYTRDVVRRHMVSGLGFTETLVVMENAVQTMYVVQIGTRLDGSIFLYRTHESHYRPSIDNIIVRARARAVYTGLPPEPYIRLSYALFYVECTFLHGK